MSSAPDRLPTILLAGVLLLIFASMRKQNHTARFRLWFYAWILIFLRFCMQLWYDTVGMPSNLYLAIDLSILQVAGIIFLSSVSAVSDRRIAPFTLIAVTACPMVFYAFAMTYGFAPPWVYMVCLLTVVIGGRAHGFYAGGHSIWNFALLMTASGLGIWASFIVSRGRPAAGFHLFMAMTYAFAGALFIRKYRRLTSGVVTTATGFLAWAAVDPIVYWNMEGTARTPENTGLLSLPKFVVAIGMIVTLLEDERLEAESARTRERLLNQQLRRFGDLTSQLLSGVDVALFATKVAEAISDTSNYQSTAVLLIDANKQIYVAGHCGFEDDAVAELQEQAHAFTPHSGTAVLLAGERIGDNSYRSSLLSRLGRDAGANGNMPASQESLEGEVSVPLRSANGIFMGLILLARPKNAGNVKAEDLSTIEVLARDLAGAIERADLQKQLLRSEKMAGMGQLVAGVAHELNNPLTAVLGYTEILTEQISDVALQRELGIVRKEALRMKRIIENLQRFSRQQKVQRRSVDLSLIVGELLKLRGYDIQSRSVQVEVDIGPGLSNIVADDSLFNQVLLNVLNNAMEAVEATSEKRILIEGRSVDGEVQLRVCDSGSGFPDVNRVFDPFYTTKAPGKGTGLGLSICYGIIKDHGGEIIATNLEGGGACITIKLPLVPPESADLQAAASKPVRD